ncbi:MAG: UDP-N-acetylglucosamine 2-epimerase (non-hydrolyzing) [Bacteroidota bacterium]
MKKLLIVVGTRPNFIKITRFHAILSQYPDIDLKVVHTGQHYDDKMSSIFFSQFGFQPDYWLNVSSGTPAARMGEIILRLEELMRETYNPDCVMVVGDVDSTLAASITAHKMGKMLVHLESGLRSFDRGMPEENNRILTDEITDHFFVTEESGEKHLQSAGKASAHIHMVGNTMIDTLVHFDEQIQQSQILEELGIQPQEFVLMTMHRPATVDVKEGLQKLLRILENVSELRQVIFPIHPRTKARFESFGLMEELLSLEQVKLADPMGYFSFQKLIHSCKYVLTDSGGIQEETTFRKIPCLTLRPNTERPITVDLGTNTLVPFDVEIIMGLVNQIETDTYKKGQLPPLWDGKATDRIVAILSSLLQNEKLAIQN